MASWQAQLEAARQVSGLSVDDLWVRYFALGGTLPPEALRAFFGGSGTGEVPDPEVLVHTLNESFAEAGLGHPVPYPGETDGGGPGPAPVVRDAQLLSRLRQVVPRLIDAAAQLEPDELPGLVSREARRAGLEEACVFLVDHEQRVLEPLLEQPGLGPLDVEGTLAGRAFQSERTVTVARDDGRWVIWMPLLDGAERLGVLQLLSPFVSDALLEVAQRVAGLVAELVVSKTQYGDGLRMARRREEMTLTAELRWPVLPPLTFSSGRLGISCVLEPAYDVAGDAFDYAINGGVLHFAIFDAMGHGLEATQMANLALGAYRHSRRRHADLTSTFRAIDTLLGKTFGGDHFVTAQLATLDSETGVLRWLSGGHPYPLVLRRGRLATELATDPSLPMGLGFDPAEEAEISLEPGDHLLFFTDGVVEARSPGGERFGQERLVDLTIRALADQQTVSETARRLVRSVRLHRSGPLQDDATLLFVRWDPTGRRNGRGED